MTRKVFVEVHAKFDPDGNVIPYSIVWEDGRVFEIDKVLDKRKAASMKAGGIGMRYTIQVNQKETYLWYEEPKWFVEGK
ncbi:MAG: hypothetical protein ACC608_03090 [Anaerofustis sp.]